MSLKAMTLVRERSRAKGSNFLMLLMIADYAKDDGRWAFPGAGTLGRHCRLTDRGGELVLRKLVEDREVEPEWSEADRRLYLHVRCICDWAAYQTEGPVYQPEKISRSHSENFSRRLVALARRNPKRSAANPKTAVGIPKSADRYKEDPKDPKDPIRAGDGLAAAPVDACGKPDDGEGTEKPLAVITKVVHTLVDLQGPFESLGDLTEAVKGFCARPPGGGDPIPYDSDVVRRAIDSAEVQRRGAGKLPLVKLAVAR